MLSNTFSRYHRILRKDKVKQQIKDFEKLKEDDPEAALEQMNQIERVRAAERATLRHRNTGRWAKNMAIRAKYDKEVDFFKFSCSFFSLSAKK